MALLLHVHRYVLALEATICTLSLHQERFGGREGGRDRDGEKEKEIGGGMEGGRERERGSRRKMERRKEREIRGVKEGG